MMLTKSDAADLEQLMELSSNQLAADFLTEYAIHSHARHMVLSSELFGDFDYPKVWSQENLIFVLGQGQWYGTIAIYQSIYLLFTNLSTYLSINLSTYISIFLSTYPSISLPIHQSIYVRGAYLTRSIAENNWQLFVVSRADFIRAPLQALAPPFSLPTDGSLQQLSVDLPPSVLSDPVQLYAYSLLRKCPNNIIIRRDSSTEGLVVVRSSRPS